MAETAFDSLMAAISYIKYRPVTYRFIEFMQTSDNSDLLFAQHVQSDMIIYIITDSGMMSHLSFIDG